MSPLIPKGPQIVNGLVGVGPEIMRELYAPAVQQDAHEIERIVRIDTAVSVWRPGDKTLLHPRSQYFSGTTDRTVSGATATSLIRHVR